MDLDDPKLLELAYSFFDPALIYLTDDDTDIRKTLPMTFEETGYPHFLELMRRLTNGEMKGDFYLDSYVPMEIPDGYYKDLLAYHSTCGSNKQGFPDYNDIGDLRENYIFYYKQGRADRIIQLTFLKGIQLIARDDEYLFFNK